MKPFVTILLSVIASSTPCAVVSAQTSSATVATATVADAPKETLPDPLPLPKPKAKDDEPVAKFSGGPGKGLTVELGEVFSLNLRSRIQVRYQLNLPPQVRGDRPTKQIVNIGTLRLSLSGHVLRRELTYLIQLALAGRDYRDGTVSPVFDAFVDWKMHRDLNVRAGQFFVPFDRLRTVREFALQLADRPRPIGEMTLDRDVGILLYSDKLFGDKSPVAYRAGAFGGGGINLIDSKDPGGMLMARLELRPLGPIDDDSEGDLERRAAPGLALGVGVAQNWNTNRQRSTTGTFFAGGTVDFLHFAADLTFKWRGFALQAEYLYRKASEDALESMDVMGMPRVEPTRSGQGWITQASYTFDPPFEVVGRLSRLYALSGTDPRYTREVIDLGQEIAAGVNYYFNGHRFKLQTDWIVRMNRDFELNRADHVVHVQLDATF